MRSIWNCLVFPPLSAGVTLSTVPVSQLQIGEPKPTTSAIWRPWQLASCFITEAWNQGQYTSRTETGTWSPVCGDKAAIMWNLTELQRGSRSHCGRRLQSPLSGRSLEEKRGGRCSQCELNPGKIQGRFREDPSTISKERDERLK